ncbi:MAG: hypothetical protein V3R89_01820 [Thermoanaerobaculia bacterium]
MPAFLPRPLLVAAGLMLAAAVPAPAPGDFLRGVVVSCPRWGPVWGSPAMARSLEELKALGVDWVAIHPYAWLRKNGEVEFQPARELDFLRRAVELAEAAGVQLFWKPHLGYWGSFAWRGDIAFGDDEAAWRRFFDSYRAFIVDQARFAQAAGVQLLAVGVEYDKTAGRESEWRQIIAAVRQVYQGKITYAANWDSLQRVPFWDAVDLIGVHAYFPLAEDANPDRETLWKGWDRHLIRLKDLSTRQGGKRVLFAEIGYNRSAEAARVPWTRAMDDRPANRELRRRLFEVALERIEAEPAIAGMFWWKWIPGPDRFDRDFSMKDPEARGALERYWGGRGGVGPEEARGSSTSE